MPRPILATLACSLLTLCATLDVASAASPEREGFRILHAERVAIDGLPSAAERARAAAANAARGETGASSAAAPRASFEAYGRRFDLVLESNARVAPAHAGQPDAPALYRGTLAGQPRSWVRLTVASGRRYGMVWDGRDLYVIEPAVEAAPSLVAPPVAGARTAAAGSPEDTVVYRLSDTLVPEGSALCGTRTLDRPEGERSGLAAYRRLVGELQAGAAAGTAGSPLVANAMAVTRRLQVTVVADWELVQQVGVVGARDRIIARFNSIDGIFSQQVGVQVEILGQVAVFDSPQQPFSSLAPRTLLEQVGAYRQSLATRGGLTHLVTGRNLEGTTVGIAYIDALCNARFGVSLSENSGSFAELVAAHELGHNFGAPHDGDVEQACADTPSTQYLMGPQVNGRREFSACSLEQMLTALPDAACLLPPSVAVDLQFNPDANPSGVVVGSTYTVGGSLRHLGTAGTSNVQLRFTLPAGATVAESSATYDGTCATEAGGITCTWPTFAPAAVANATIRLRAEAAGTLTIGAAVTAPGDTNAANDSASFTVQIGAANAPAPAAAAPASGGGGGGAFGGAGLLALAALAWRRRISAASGRC